MNWSLPKKLWALAAILLTTILAVGGVSVFVVKSMIHQIDSLAQVNLPAVRAVTLVDMMHDGLRANLYSAILWAEEVPVGSREDVLKELEEFSALMRQSIEELRKLNLTPEVKAQVEQTMPTMEGYLATSDRLVNLAVSGEREAVLKEIASFQEAFERLEKDMEILGSFIEKGAQDVSQESIAAASRFNILIMTLVGAGFFAGLGFTVVMMRQAMRTMNAVAQKVSDSAQNLVRITENVDESAKQLSSSTHQQGNEIQKTVASMSEIGTMLERTNESSQSSLRLSHTGQGEVEKGRVVITQLVSAMDGIGQATEKMRSMVTLINEVGEKTKVINDIVFKTSLLSFNASIEAARAGAHGRGFAVVAEEVGNLAAMSGRAAEDIRRLIDGSKAEIQEFAASTTDKIQVGRRVADNCVDVFAAMDRAMAQIAQAISDIAAASKQQTIGVHESNTAMMEMNKLTDHNLGNSQNLAEQANRLWVGTRELKEAVVSLEYMVHGQSRKEREYMMGELVRQEASSDRSEPQSSVAA